MLQGWYYVEDEEDVEEIGGSLTHKLTSRVDDTRRFDRAIRQLLLSILFFIQQFQSYGRKLDFWNCVLQTL